MKEGGISEAMASVVRGYKTELDLNNEQRTACLKHAGCVLGDNKNGSPALFVLSSTILVDERFSICFKSHSSERRFARVSS